MTLPSYLTRQYLQLAKPNTGKILVDKNIRIPMRDGVELLADRYYSADGVKRPLVLVRSFYGRKFFFGMILGRVIAEQGFQVLIQSCRGTYDSEGELLPLLNEKDDGIDTVDWMKEQDWYPGYFATTGPSYLGYVQWAIAGSVGDDLKAMAVQITASNFRGMGFPGDSFALNTVLTWMYLVNKQKNDLQVTIAFLTMYPKLRRAFKQLPFKELDKFLLKKQVDFWQLLLMMGESQDGEMTVANYSDCIPGLEAPVTMQGGWYDIFLPWMIKDFAALQDCGKNARIVVGPWTHVNIAGGAEGLKDSISWLRSILLNDKSGERESPLKLFVMGAKEWRYYKSWPPEDSEFQRWYLQPGGNLAKTPADESEPDSYIYDPENPTPALGGPTLFEFIGYRNNSSIEKRDDILIFDSALLTESIEIAGPVSAELYISSSLEYTDFFVRLCDLYPSGKSINICDGLQRIRPDRYPKADDGTVKVTIEMWPTAYFFRRGHRIRIQVSSGSHPRYARNPGTDESLGSACTLNKAHQKIYHDPIHPSAVILPYIKKEDSGTLNGEPVKCIWCNDDDGIFKETDVGKRFSAKDKKPTSEKLPVHPKHEKPARNFIRKSDSIGAFLFIALILNLLLTAGGLTGLLVAGFNDSLDIFAAWIFIVPPVIVISLLLLAFPYAAPYRMVAYMGMKRTVIIVRILATGTLITAFSQFL